MFFKFMTALSWLIAVPCAIAVVCLFLGLLFSRQSEAENKRSISALVDYFKWGLIPWAWLAAKYLM